MINIKSLGVGIGLSAVAAMMLANPANGLININGVGSSSNTSYSGDVFDADDYDSIERCRITKPSFFYDTNILYRYAEDNLNKNYKVYDLDGLSINSNYGIGFSDGIYVTDEIVEPNFSKYIVHCDYDDFDDFRRDLDISWNRISDYEFYSYDDYTCYTITYDKYDKIMTYEIMYGVAG